jgi:hypothetical protein
MRGPPPSRLTATMRAKATMRTCTLSKGSTRMRRTGPGESRFVSEEAGDGTEGLTAFVSTRARILGMNELERENILGERSERQNAETQRQNLRMMVRAKEQGLSGATGESPGKQGGRDRTQTGATNAKKETLLKLKKSREMKGKKSATTVVS